jgi:hypothetical protein
MHHTDRKLSVHKNLDKRIAEAQGYINRIYEADHTASVKCVQMMKANAVLQALVALRDESQTEGAL